MATTISDRVVVMGGGLKGKAMWLPREVYQQGDTRFVTLHGNDYQCAADLGFCGGLSHNEQLHAVNKHGFLDLLRDIRNKKIENVQLAIVREKYDGYAQAMTAAWRKRITEADLPDTVDLDLDGHIVTVRATTHVLKSVTLKLCERNLEALRAYAQTFLEEGVGKTRRPRNVRVSTGYKCIGVSHNKSEVLTSYISKNGKRKRHHEPCADLTDADELQAATLRTNSINQSRTKTEQNAMNVKGRIASTTARTCQPWGAMLIRLGRIVW